MKNYYKVKTSVLTRSNSLISLRFIFIMFLCGCNKFEYGVYKTKDGESPTNLNAENLEN